MRKLAWRRIRRGLSYLRANGVAATWRRLTNSPGSYAAWIQAYDRLQPQDVGAILSHIAELPRKPLISVIQPRASDDLDSLAKDIGGVITQLYPYWELIICSREPVDALRSKLKDDVRVNLRIKLVQAHRSNDWAALAKAGLSAATGEFVLFLDEQDQLAPHAIYRLVAEICNEITPDIIYSDEDEIDARGDRCFPKFKTDWNPDLLRSYNYLGRITAYRRELLTRIGGIDCDLTSVAEYDLNLRLAEKTSAPNVRHVPMILYHRSQKSSVSSSPDNTVSAVQRHLTRSGIAANAVALSSGHVRVRYSVPAALPDISLIVPTRDRLPLLRRCIDGLLSSTEASNTEIVIVDNDSQLSETREYLKNVIANRRVHVLHIAGPFNYSSINNQAAKSTTTSLIGFVNNDVEVICPDWLNEMATLALRPEIGVVGAKLFYPNNTIQHAGTIVGLGGLAGHAFRHFSRNDVGYLHRLSLTQNISAVTGACMLMRRHVFEQVGGFDEINLPVAYSDVDICLRVAEAGYLNLWTPFAQLYHHEFGSRPHDYSSERIEHYQREVDYLKYRWKTMIEYDPFYNPNLTIEAEDFRLAFPPRVLRPWQHIRPTAR